jgi:hypothetical protein
MATMNKPSTMVLAATQHDSLLHLIDCRLGNIVTDLKVCLGSAGLIRCLSSDPDGYTVTIGHSSGFISQLDIRIGKLRQAWKVLTITTQYLCLLRFIFLEILSLKLSVVVFYSI